MKVKVTKKHIMKGECLDSESCPIELALKESTHKRVKVIESDDIYIDGIQYRVPQKNDASEVNKFIENFDNGYLNRISPFSFELVPA
jgi:hypothetical protein